jgi:HD-GYP domain-containing protein (c-di-GMP phosphodiesterase class II)
VPPRRSWHLIGLPPVEEALPQRGPFEQLEEFLQQLQPLLDSSAQLRLAMQTVQQSVRADAVFACTTDFNQPVEYVGEPRLTAQWCVSFARQLLRDPDAVQSGCLTAEQAPKPGSQPAPRSVALVRLSKSRQAWLVALRFRQERPFDRADVQFMRLARRLVLQHRQQTQTFEKLKESVFGLVKCLAASLDARDPYTWGHSERVARIGVRIGRQMRLPESTLNEVYLGGLLHDIGKIGVRDAILSKPGPLTPEERRHLQQHTVIGDAILAPVAHLSHLRPAVRSHHEHYDGRGYPDRLAGEAIPLIARLLAAADATDAMLSERPYREGLSREQVARILGEGTGRQWDPAVVAALLECHDEVFAIHERGLGESVARAVEQAVRVNTTATTPPSFLHPARI